MRLTSSQDIHHLYTLHIYLHTSLEKMLLTILSTDTIIYTCPVCAVIHFLKVDHFVV